MARLSLKAAGNAGFALIAGLFSLASLQQVSAEGASSFPLSDVQLTQSRWMDNQDRTLAYLLFVDPDRLLYNFRSTHHLDTQGAQTNGGWDAPDFPFRSHAQGHFLTAWAQCAATLKNDDCLDRVTYFVAELAKAQANNQAAGFSTGYLSGFPESDFDKLEGGTLTNGNVPYYAVHKTMAGLFDAWKLVGDETARDVLLAMAGWVDSRTSKLSEDAMQRMMGTEYGGMNDILTLLYQETKDDQWLKVAQRFDHAAVFDPLAEGRDQLSGLHANTQAAKLVGVIREYQATGTQRYLDIAKNAWDIIVGAHTYAIGGNSQAEHFHEPNGIADYLDKDACETCNTYNMLKFTRELWASSPGAPSASYFDFYERALLNHLLGVQHPSSDHGHITYFTSLNPGGRRGVGPAWGGGTWSTDYDSFWCCQSTSVETNTKLMDSIYWHDDTSEDQPVLYVNLYISSKLTWADKDVTVTQNTTIPETDTSTISIEPGSSAGPFALRLRIPEWTTADAQVLINGEQDDTAVSGVEPGAYATVQREWQAGDKVTVQFPMAVRTIPANDDPNTVAIAYGPAVLAGKYGDSTLNGVPGIEVDSVKRVDGGGLQFEATSGGQKISLDPFYDSHDYNYNVYWKIN
ncbi:uncharacterized protein C8A04DRAFT_37959 [Dichotomopilus funicola]|uniref:Secreted protein n=1 Tax=Dichotomopilus funicola TaxID=1934379 RepID=A0AAN6V2N8_9PEZI|nr:hypothetical protein C8A04DRAFT_37959 [Dichotomopilus funicola]